MQVLVIESCGASEPAIEEQLGSDPKPNPPFKNSWEGGKRKVQASRKRCYERAPAAVSLSQPSIQKWTFPLA